MWNLFKFDNINVLIVCIVRFYCCDDNCQFYGKDRKRLWKKYNRENSFQKNAEHVTFL